MRLDITKQRGDVTTFSMSTDGKPVVVLVNDPANGGKPAQEVKAWVEEAGGTAPLKGVGDGHGL